MLWQKRTDVVRAENHQHSKFNILESKRSSTLLYRARKPLLAPQSSFQLQSSPELLQTLVDNSFGRNQPLNDLGVKSGYPITIKTTPSSGIKVLEQGLTGKAENDQVEVLFNVQHASMRAINGLDGNKEPMREYVRLGLFEDEDAGFKVQTHA
ncbi:hypothetical protein BGX38DRAFT_1271626 [Terfezia claveryi]|nr:hypothetical protein BGX38DRAFT_1271626 [Terfezia claveryi]